MNENNTETKPETAAKQETSEDCHPLYTPGPWVADGERVKDAENECWIADCNVSSFLPVHEIPANVRIIASAPKMVKALQLAKRVFDGNGIDMEAYDAVLDALEAALGDSWMNAELSRGDSAPDA